MLFEDVVEGKKYRMVENEDDYIRAGAIVKVVELDEGSSLDVRVQDLSDDKLLNGIWWTNARKLEPIEEQAVTSSYASEALEHYTRQEQANKHYATAHQPIEVMQANMTHDELIGFLKGNIIKYACRCGRKDDPKKEAAKIKQYAEWLCVVLDEGTIDPRV